MTEAAHGSLKPPPTRRSRRAFLHLSHSMTLPRLLDTPPLADCRCLMSDAPERGDRSRRGHGGKRNLFAPVAGRLVAGLSEREPSKAPMPSLRLEPPQSSPVAAQRGAAGAGLDGGAPCRSTIGGAVRRSIPAVAAPPGERMQPPAPATAVSRCTFLAASTTAGVDIDEPLSCRNVSTSLIQPGSEFRPGV